MRISRNDQPVSIYTYTSTTSADGLVQNSYTLAYSINADVQPVGVRFNPALYGINATSANIRKMFFDNGYSVKVGDCVKVGGDGYMIKAIDDWYNHQEAILEPWEAVLP